MKIHPAPLAILTLAASATLGSCGDMEDPTDVDTSDITLPTFPTATGTQNVTSTIKVSGTFDGKLKRYQGTSGSQSESQPPLFELADGSTIQTVIIGNLGQDGIHCKGTCTIKNVWWEDVGEDAATQKGTKSGQVMTIDGGGARAAADKIFQHNGPGTMIIKNFFADNFGKLYRSCGNCSTQYKRTVQISNVIARTGKALAGVNQNYGDSATLTNITIVGSTKPSICDRYQGNNTGAEPTKIGSGISPPWCNYASSDIHFTN
jgi:pectate lyase